MWVTAICLYLLGGSLAVGRECIWYMNWHFEAYGGILCSVVIWGEGLALSQLNMVEFVDSQKEALHPQRSGWGWDAGVRKGVGGRAGSGM